MTILQRIRAAIHVLRGRPIIANNRFSGGIYIDPSARNVFVSNNKIGH